MKSVFLFIIVICFFLSCESQKSFIESRLLTAEKFVECLQKNDPDKLLQFAHPNADDNLHNKEIREFGVQFASQYIKKYGLPEKEQWVINYDPANNVDRLVVVVPLFEGYDSATHLFSSRIVLNFPPPEISDKVHRYKIDNKVDIEKVDFKPPVFLKKEENH